MAALMAAQSKESRRGCEISVSQDPVMADMNIKDAISVT